MAGGERTKYARIDDGIAPSGAKSRKRFQDAPAFCAWYRCRTVVRLAREKMDTDAAPLTNRLLLFSAVVR